MSKWFTTSCNNCGDEIRYHEDWNRVPDLCSDCIAEKRAERAKWHETTCDDCGGTIKYHEDWNRVPDLCKSCIAERRRQREEEKAKWQEKSCADCNDRIKYHVDWNRVPDLCKDCIAKKKRLREEAQAKWKEASCSRCHSTIKYNTDWNRIPDLCKDCRAKITEEQAKWHTKNCTLCSNTIKYHQDWTRVPDYCKSCNEWQTKACEAQDCNNTIQYKKYWTNISDYCKPCKSGENEVTERRPRPDGGWDEYTGKGYVNKNGVIVFTDDSRRGKHSHTVYNADGTIRGHRDEGHGKDFQRDDLSQTTCERCGDYFDYPSRWDNTPKFCRDCGDIVREERNEKKQIQENRKLAQRQQVIKFKEYHETVTQTKSDGKTHIYTGTNISGKESVGTDGVFAHDHGHKAFNPDGTPYYNRGESGEILDPSDPPHLDK